MTRETQPLADHTSAQLLAMAIQEHQENVGKLHTLNIELAKTRSKGTAPPTELQEKVESLNKIVKSSEASIRSELNVMANDTKHIEDSDSMEENELVKNVTLMENTLRKVKEKRIESENLLSSYNSAVGKAAGSLRASQSYGARMAALLFLAIAMLFLTFMIVFHNRFSTYGVIIIVGCGIVSLYHFLRYIMRQWW